MSPSNNEEVKASIKAALINSKVNACPMAVRLAWHASGTYCKTQGNGGSDGATMRFEPESTDGANAGLGIMRDILAPVKEAHPDVSIADIWTLAGAQAIQFTNPSTDVSIDVPHNFGRTDASDNATCPMNGRLPDASQGAAHLRDVFYRMGFNDKEIVVLSGAHTLGRCHVTRSGFDGPWTHNPLEFDNSYFVNLLSLKWVPRDWDGPLQYSDAESGELMMLPTDIALIEDEAFLPYVKVYAVDNAQFCKDFSAAFGKLLALGCPAHCQPSHVTTEEEVDMDAAFREHAMHGSLERMKELTSGGKAVDYASKDEGSGRTALHKAAFWGHAHVIQYLLEVVTDEEAKLALVNALDSQGDTALHDAARFGHKECVELLCGAGADLSIVNGKGKTAKDEASVSHAELCGLLE